MKHSVTLKTLIIVSVVMIITTLSFSTGYFKAKIDFQKFSDTYVVSVERPSKSAQLEKEESSEVAEDNIALLVNINTASVVQLETLPGIGAVLAERIISYREENGEFQSRYNIMDVPGIGTGIYEKIKDSICVSDQK